MKVDPRGRSGFSCWACGASGSSAIDLIHQLRRKSGQSYKDAREFIRENATAGGGVSDLGPSGGSKYAKGSSSDRSFDYTSGGEDEEETERFDPVDRFRQDPDAYRLPTLESTGVTETDSASRPALDESELASYEERVHPYLIERGFEAEACREWGLMVSKDNPMRYERIVFPIRDINDRLLAYSRRVTWDEPKCQSCRYTNEEGGHGEFKFGVNSCPRCGSWVWPKYQHSKGFNRNMYLYGEHMIETDGLSTGVVVEGNLDPIKLYQHGVRNVVATLGSNIGKRWPDPDDDQPGEQMYWLQKFFDQVVVVADGDAAGYKWMKSIEEFFSAREHMLWVETVQCPDGMDPGDLSQRQIKSMLGGYSVFGAPF